MRASITRFNRTSLSLAAVLAGLTSLGCTLAAEEPAGDGDGDGDASGTGGLFPVGSTGGAGTGGDGVATGGGANGTGGAGTGGLGSGGLGSGGAGTGGEGTGGGGTGGSGSGGNTNLPEPGTNSTFSNLDGWHVASKSDLIPGATAVIGSDAGASDDAVLTLTIPGNPAFTSASYVGPGAHAIEVVKDGGAQLYGRYEFDVSFPSCGSDEELVSGLFTYFNDGSDEDEDGVNDNSEIDIEHLCGDPQILWFTVWTDYEEVPSTAFRRSSRAINMRTGAYRETSLGNDSWGDEWTNGSLSDLAIENFPVPGAYYTLGFEWTQDSVRYFIIDGGEEKDLFTVSGAAYVPQRAASLLLNFWHPSTQWWDNVSADFPKSTAVLRFDGVRVWTADQL